MNEFLKEGQYMSIPVAVFYDKDHDYICHWIERSQAANREQGEIEAAIRAEQPDINDQDFGRQRRARHFCSRRGLAAGYGKRTGRNPPGAPALARR